MAITREPIIRLTSFKFIIARIEELIQHTSDTQIKKHTVLHYKMKTEAREFSLISQGAQTPFTGNKIKGIREAI